jgi:hypothetical protein
MSSILWRVRPRVRLLFCDRAMVFDQAPVVLPTTECAAHRHHAPAEHDKIAGLGAELRFQVAACRRARELYAGLYAHLDTPLLAGMRWYGLLPNGLNADSLPKKIGQHAERIISPTT